MSETTLFPYDINELTLEKNVIHVKRCSIYFGHNKGRVTLLVSRKNGSNKVEIIKKEV